MKSKKIIFRIINRLTIGGPLHHIINLNNLDGYETIILHGQLDKGEIYPTEFLSNKNLRLIELKFLRRKINLVYDLLSIFELIYWILRHRPEIIHTHTSKPGLIGRVSGKICRVNKIYHTFHGNIFNGYFSNKTNKLFILIERVLANYFSSKIIAISKTQKKDLVDLYKICDSDKCKIIPLGFDLEVLQSVNRSNRLRKEYNISEHTFLIGIIGRLVPIKNHQLLIKAFISIVQRFDLNTKLVIIGDGIERQKLIDLVQYSARDNFFEIRNKIIFTSWRSDINQIIKDFDLICLSSLNEGTPVAIIEAISANVPVLSTNVGGVDDIIDERFGWIIENFCPNDLSNKIVNIIQDKDSLKNIRTGEREDFILKYSSNTLRNNIINLYNDGTDKENQ